MKNKKLVIIFTICILFNSIKQNTAFASYKYSNKTSIKNEQVRKNTKISTKNKETNKTSIASENCLIKGNAPVIINENTKSQENKESIKISANNLSSQIIINPIETEKVDLNIAKTISLINNIDISIQENDIFELPTMINANMSNGEIEKVNVLWDKSLDTTSMPGKYTYCGNVDGYPTKIYLNLTINPKIKDNTINQEIESHSKLHKDLYSYLISQENRQSVMKRAVQLHNGISSNTCVYFSSEALRRVGVTNLSKSVCNTKTLTAKLNEMGWERSSDLSQLRPGDICFTTFRGKSSTHAYVFMNWVDESSHEYAYICDNQSEEYEDNYHIRNINFATSKKEAILYFMYKAE